MRSDKHLRAWYRDINTRFFDNELPDNVCVKWGGREEQDEEEEWEQRYNGFVQPLLNDPYHSAVIVLNPELRTNACFKLATLVHEMIHIATNFRDDHGPAFERHREMLAVKGIFKKNALLRGITLF